MKIKTSEIKTYLKLIRENDQCITEIEIVQDELDRDAYDQMKLLFEALKNNTQIKVLKIKTSKFHTSDFIDMFKTNKTIQTLAMERNLYGDSNAKLLMRCFLFHPALQSLELSHCLGKAFTFGEIGVIETLADVLKQHPGIKNVDVFNNDILEHEFVLLSTALQDNRGITQYKLPNRYWVAASLFDFYDVKVDMEKVESLRQRQLTTDKYDHNNRFFPLRESTSGTPAEQKSEFKNDTNSIRTEVEKFILLLEMDCKLEYNPNNFVRLSALKFLEYTLKKKGIVDSQDIKELLVNFPTAFTGPLREPISLFFEGLKNIQTPSQDFQQPDKMSSTQLQTCFSVGCQIL